MLQMQIVDTCIRISSPTEAFASSFGRYVNTADHHLPPAASITFDVLHDGEAYVLPSGRRELSSFISADAAWRDMTEMLQVKLASWLYVSGLCIDSGGQRILVLGEDLISLRWLALFALSQGIDVSSVTGICIRDGIAVPYAQPLEISEMNLSRFRAITGCGATGREWRDEMGRNITVLTPADFGLAWCIRPRPVDGILVLAWNPGGWSGLGGSHQPAAALNRIVESVLLPPKLPPQEKLAIIVQAKPLAANAPMRKLHLGRPEDFASLVREHVGIISARV